ncbi:MAG: LPXTG cell wall anchor domain-containing protein [Ilumatobacteraceae bacterium]
MCYCSAPQRAAGATTAPAQEEAADEDGGSKLGLLGLVGLAGLAGLAGLKRRDDSYDNRSTTTQNR